MTRPAHGKESGMRPTPTQPFHTDLDPNLGHLVDDFLAEIDRLLRKIEEMTCSLSSSPSTPPRR